LPSLAGDIGKGELPVMSSKRLNRRQFLRRLSALGLTAGGAALLSACGAKPTPELMRVATSAPTAAPTTPAPVPTGTSTSAPSATATLAPTQASTQAPTNAPTPTATVPPTSTPAPSATPAPAYLVVVHGADPAEITRRAIAAVGGIERFVKKGANVIVKPNICVAYNGPEYAATTNPQVVATLVQLCLGAGAKRVRVMDFPFGGTAQAAYARSGIEAAVKGVGGEMEIMSQIKYRAIKIPDGKAIKEWDVYGEILDADLVINVPIAKTHGNTRLTLGMKNMMGAVQDRSGFHSRGLDQCIVDLWPAVKPQLTVVDAVRMLMANGPTGGDLNDVKKADTVIASTDVVAADAYATGLFGKKPDDIGYIRLGAAKGLGQKDLTGIKIEEINV